MWSELVTRSLTTVAWWCVLGSGFCAAAYLFALARAYETSDFTVVYPLASSLPVIFVAIADVLRGQILDPMGLGGDPCSSRSAALLVPLSSFTDIHLKNYLNRASVWVLLAAMGPSATRYWISTQPRSSSREQIRQPAMGTSISVYLPALSLFYENVQQRRGKETDSRVGSLPSLPGFWDLPPTG